MAINSPEGTRDLLPDEAKFWAHFRDTAFGIFARYGYQPIETPLFEQTDLFVRGIGQATDDAVVLHGDDVAALLGVL